MKTPTSQRSGTPAGGLQFTIYDFPIRLSPARLRKIILVNKWASRYGRGAFTDARNGIPCNPHGSRRIDDPTETALRDNNEA